MNGSDTKPSERKQYNFILWIFLAFILYFSVKEHWVHIVPYLPWLLLAACPLMHVFIHGGHGHTSHGNDKEHPER